MAYRFEPAKSYYVDPRSVEVSQILNDRFTQNFAVNDALNTAIRDMQYASFENDTTLAKELRQSTNSKLQQLAEKGDYENMTFPLHSLAKETGNKLKPLSENYARVQAYMKEIEDQYKAGKINAVARQEALNYSSHGYKGVEIDPQTGQAKQGSFFNGVKVVQDPDILKKLNEGLARMKASGDVSKIRQVGQGPDAQYQVFTERGWEGIKASDIKDVYDTIINEPDVQAFLNQQADFNVYKISEDGLQTWANTSLEKYNAMLANKGLSKDVREQINSKITDLQTSVSDPTKLRALAKKAVIENKLQDYQTYAIKSTEYSKTTSANETTWDQKYLIDYKTVAENPSLQKASEVRASALDGATADEKLKNARGFIEQATILEKEAADTSLDPAVKAEKLAAAKKFRDRASIIEQHVAKAGNATYTLADFEKQDPTLFGVIKEMYPGKTAGEYAVIMARTFDSAWDQDYKNFESTFDKKYGEGAFIKHFTRFYDATTAVDISDGSNDWKWMTANRPDLVRQDPSIAEDDGGFSLSSDSSAKLAVNFDKGFKNLMNDKFGWAKGDKVNAAIHEQKISSPVQYGALPALSTKESASATKAAKGYFEGLVIPEDATVINVTEDGSESITGADDALQGYKVAKYGFLADYGSSGAWELQLVDGEGKNPKTVIMTGDQVTSPELQRYMASPRTRFAQKVRAMDDGIKGNETTLDVELNDSSSSKIKLHVKADDPSNPLIAITKVNGERTQYKRIDDPEIQLLIDSQILKIY
jgi:hypothetical protein